mmetsp:Transcript_12468/g.37475  ORF Transcript_12468/g.37475 Transcript_12468/m.37475 type:complete len:225 (-) Transcript_12468:1028-1702(-)
MSAIMRLADPRDCCTTAQYTLATPGWMAVWAMRRQMSLEVFTRSIKKSMCDRVFCDPDRAVCGTGRSSGAVWMTTVWSAACRLGCQWERVVRRAITVAAVFLKGSAAVSGCRTMTVLAWPAETPSRSRRKWGAPSRVSTCRCFWWHSAPATAASIASLGWSAKMTTGPSNTGAMHMRAVLFLFAGPPSPRFSKAPGFGTLCLARAIWRSSGTAALFQPSTSVCS